jgi:hypothetical protein
MKIPLFQGKKGCNLRLGIVNIFPETGDKIFRQPWGTGVCRWREGFFPNDQGQTAGQTKQY